MGWFGRSERGMALGIRQMALPLGGAIASATLPRIVGAGGLDAALLVLAGAGLTASLSAALFMRESPPPPATAPPGVERPTRDRRQWRLGAASGLLIMGQSAMLGFVVLFLHDERGLSVGTAASALAALQLLGAGARIAAGRRSDREGARIPLLRRIALVDAALLGTVAVLVDAPGVLLYPALLSAGVVAMCWNSLAFTAAAELAGRMRAGTALSFQNTIVSIGATVAPTMPFFAAAGMASAIAWPAMISMLARCAACTISVAGGFLRRSTMAVTVMPASRKSSAAA
jgi:sugar phosphate permease